MAVDNSFMIKKITQEVKSREEMIVAFCKYTNMPFVVCDPETFNDQIYIFETEQLLQNFAKPYLEKKVLLSGVKFKNASFLQFFGSLYSIGVNELVFVNENGTESIDLSALVTKPDYSKIDPKRRPLVNDALVLTGIYFMQEAARPVAAEEKTGLKDLEEELAANMFKAKYIIPIVFADGPETPQEKIKAKKYSIPILKAKNEDILQPIFTDPLELRKFTKGKPMGAITVGFGDLARLLVSNAKGYILNPVGFHILMPRELLNGLAVRFGNAKVSAVQATVPAQNPAPAQNPEAEQNQSSESADAEQT